MKKIVLGVLLFCVLLSITGCASTQHLDIDGQSLASSLDINQDGIDDIVEVYYRTPEQVYAGENDSEKMNDLYVSFIKITVSGDETVIPVAESYIYDAAILTLTSGTHSPILIITFDIGGARGNKTIYALTYENNKIRELPLPEIEAGKFGLDFDITYLNMYEVDIYCPETGYSTKINRLKSSFEMTTDGLDSIYDEFGEVRYQPETIIHLPYSVEVVEVDTEKYLLVKQSISEIIDANVWGHIDTLLTWDENNNYVIIDQETAPLLSSE